MRTTVLLEARMFPTQIVLADTCANARMAHMPVFMDVQHHSQNPSRRFGTATTEERAVLIRHAAAIGAAAVVLTVLTTDARQLGP
jgi:hypothetical protein